MPRRATRADDYPNRDVLDDIAFGLRKSAVLKAAIELELFTRIAEGHRTVPALARIGGTSERALRALLDALVFSGLLTRQQSEYGLTPTGEAFLVKGKPAYHGDALLGDFAWDARGQLSRIVRTGKAILPAAYGEAAEPLWAGIAAANLVDWQRQIDDANAIWDKLSIAPENGKQLRVLDVGAGAGIVSIALAKRYPSARITVVDRPMVLTYTKQIVEAAGVAGRVTLLSGDALTLDFRSESYEVAWFGNITLFLSPEQNIGLLRKAFEALVPNGRVVIQAPMSDEERKGPSEVAMAGVEIVLFSPEGDVYTLTEYRGMLETAGFSEVTGVKDDWGLVTARRLVKPQTT